MFLANMYIMFRNTNIVRYHEMSIQRLILLNSKTPTPGLSPVFVLIIVAISLYYTYYHICSHETVPAIVTHAAPFSVSHISMYRSFRIHSLFFKLRCSNMKISNLDLISMSYQSSYTNFFFQKIRAKSTSLSSDLNNM